VFRRTGERFQPTLNGGNMNFKFNDMRMKSRSRLLIPLTISFFVMCAVLQAGAATLDAKAARGLLSDHMMASDDIAGSGYYYWSWNSDGTVCMRLKDKNGSCADTGPWKLQGDRVCYEFTWWGKGSGFDSACFRIVDLGKGRYEALQDNGMTLLHFHMTK
jgi:hypothetical protein